MPALERVDPSYVDRARRRCHADGIIPAPPERVWQQLVDAPGWAEWFPNCRSCEYTSGTGESGSARTVRVGAMRFDEVIVRSDENKAWAFTVVDTNLRLVTRLYEQVELEATHTADGPSTRLSYTGAFDPARWAIPTGPLLALQLSRAWSKGFEALAHRMAS